MRLIITLIITLTISFYFCNFTRIDILNLFIDNAYGSEENKSDNTKDATSEADVPKLISPSKPLALINQENEPVVLDSLIGKPIVMSFIFTRCPLPNMCPLIMQKVVKVQEELNKDCKDKVFFALITFDPEYDTPEVLKKYGENYGVDYDNLIYLTGKKDDIDKALDHFRVYAKEEAPGQISHTMETMVMDEKGVITKIFPTSIWNPKSVAKEVRRVIAKWKEKKSTEG